MNEKLNTLVAIITKIDRSFQIINQVINNLDEMISLEQRKYKLSDLLNEFKESLPNNIKEVPISFILDKCDCCINIIVISNKFATFAFTCKLCPSRGYSDYQVLKVLHFLVK